MIDSEVARANELLASGGTILYPTDTIWGIGCDATNPEAVQRIFDIKRRSDSKSMLALVSGLEMLGTYLEHIPQKALEIISSSISPITIIYPDAKNLATNLLAEDGSVGMRITSDSFCLKLLELFGRPIVSTSANISGNAPPGIFSEISPVISDQVDHVVNLRQDETKKTRSSTILKIDREGTLTVIRP